MKWAYVACLSSLLGACGWAEKHKQHTDFQAQSTAQLERQHQAFKRQVQDHEGRRLAQIVDQPWVVGKAIQLATAQHLPAVFQARFTIVLESHSSALRQVGVKIAQMTGLPVYVRPEALLPASEFLPRYARTAAVADTTIALAPMALRDMPLHVLLDHVAAQFGVYWRFQPPGIEFYRTETRYFTLRALSQEAHAQASLGLSQQAVEGFSSQSGTQLETSAQASLVAIQKRIEAFLSLSGTVVAEPGAGNMVLVTDTPEVLAKVAVYLERENRLAGRRVRLLFEEITLAINDDAEFSLDWDALLSSRYLALRAQSKGGDIVQASRLTAKESGQGSALLVQALASVATVVRTQTTPVYTLNRRPVTHALRSTFSYVDKVEALALGGNASWSQPAISISQKEQTVGSVLTLLPDIQDDGLILLSVAYDSTVAQPLKSLSFGDKQAPLQVQQISIDGSGTVQQVALRPGQLWLLSGFDRWIDEAQAQRLAPDASLLLGGANKRTQQRWRTVLLVSAQLEEED